MVNGVRLYFNHHTTACWWYDNGVLVKLANVSFTVTMQQLSNNKLELVGLLQYATVVHTLKT